MNVDLLGYTTAYIASLKGMAQALELKELMPSLKNIYVANSISGNDISNTLHSQPHARTMPFLPAAIEARLCIRSERRSHHYAPLIQVAR